MLATILRQKMKKIRLLAEITKQNVIVLHFVESKANVKLLRYSYPRINRNKTLPTYILHTLNNKQSLNYFVFYVKGRKTYFLHYFWSGILNGKKHTSQIGWNAADKNTFKWRKKNSKKMNKNVSHSIPRHILVNMVVSIKNNNNKHKHFSPRYN